MICMKQNETFDWKRLRCIGLSIQQTGITIIKNHRPIMQYCMDTVTHGSRGHSPIVTVL